MSDELQALCFIAGANSIFYGEKLLTTGNPDVEKDQQLFARLGLKTEGSTGATPPDYAANGTIGAESGRTCPKSAPLSAPWMPASTR